MLGARQQADAPSRRLRLPVQYVDLRRLTLAIMTATTATILVGRQN